MNIAGRVAPLFGRVADAFERIEKRFVVGDDASRCSHLIKQIGPSIGPEHGGFAPDPAGEAITNFSWGHGSIS